MHWFYGDWVGLVVMITIVAVMIAIMMVVGLTVWQHADRRFQQRQPRRGAESPEELLAVRFARGEIDENEYQRRRAVLRQ